MAISTIGEVEVFRHEVYRGDTFGGLTYLVRFYDEGDPPHIGPQPPLTVNTSGVVFNGASSRRRRLAETGFS